MNDVRIPQEQAARFVKVVRESPYRPTELEADLLRIIAPQLWPAYRVGDVRTTMEGIAVCMDDRMSRWTVIRPDDKLSWRTDAHIEPSRPTGLNLRDLVEHLKKGPVAWLTEEQAEALGGKEDGYTVEVEAKSVVFSALEHWRENHKP